MSSKRKISRRAFAKTAAGTIAGLAVGAGVGYMASQAMKPPVAPGVTTTVTKTVTGAAPTMTTPKPTTYEPIDVRYGSLSGSLHQPTWHFAEHLGLWEKYNINVTRSEYPKGPDLVQHYATGDLDVGACGVIPTIRGRVQGVDAISVMQNNIEGSAIVVDSSKIEKPEDMDGLDIGSPGIGTTMHMQLLAAEKKWGFKVNHKPAKASDLPVYFEGGELDGFISREPYYLIPLESDKRPAKILLKSSDITPGIQCCHMFVSEDWYKNHPDWVQRIVNVGVEVSKFIDDPANVETVIDLQTDHAGVDRALVSRLIKEEWLKFRYPPYNDLDSFAFQTQMLIDLEYIKKDDVPDIDAFLKTWVTNEFVEKAVRG